LYEECVKYFKHCDNTPWVKIDFKVVAGELKKIEIPTQRPYTWAGLCTFLGVNRKYFYDFQENCSEEFSDIISYVRDIIEGNKIEGALVGAYNSNIVALLLGLKNKEEKEKEEDEPPVTIEFSDEQD